MSPYNDAETVLQVIEAQLAQGPYLLGETMSAYLVNFVKRGDPNGEGLPQWPRYRADGGKQMDFATSGDAVAD